MTLQTAEHCFSPAQTSAFGKFDSKLNLTHRGEEYPSAALTPPSLSLLLLESTCGRSIPSCRHEKKKSLLAKRKEEDQSSKTFEKQITQRFSGSSGCSGRLSAAFCISIIFFFFF